MMRVVGAVRLMRWVVPCDNILVLYHTSTSVLYLGGVCLVLLLLLSRGLCSGRRPFRLFVEQIAFWDYYGLSSRYALN